MVNYQNGKVYKIINTVNRKIFVGETTSWYLTDCLADHRASSKSPKSFFHREMNRLGSKTFKIVLLELVSCDSKDELNVKVQKWINELKPQINKNKVSLLDDPIKMKAFCKKNYQLHKEKINARSLAYYYSNQNKLKEKAAQYRKENLERFGAARREKVNCPHCHMALARSSLTKHKKLKH